jgi:TolB-like protein
MHGKAGLRFLALAAVVLAVSSCMTGPVVPTDPDSSLLVIPAAARARNFDANLRSVRIDPDNVPLAQIYYSVAIQGSLMPVRVDPASGDAVISLKAGAYNLGPIYQEVDANTEVIASARGGSNVDKHTRIELSPPLRLTVTLKQRQITVLPYKFVYVLVNENAETGLGTLALKVRNLTPQERESLPAELKSNTTIAGWDAVNIDVGPEWSQVYPLAVSRVPVVVRTVSAEYTPAGGAPAAAAAAPATPAAPPAAQPAPRPAAAAPAVAAPAPSAARAKVAVLDFKNNGLLQGDAAVLVDLLSSALARTPRFQILERSNIERVMREAQFAKSDAADQSSQLQIGKMLAADYVVVGSVARVGSRYIMDARIVAVITGETERSSSVVRNSLDELIDGIKSVAAELGQR